MSDCSSLADIRTAVLNDPAKCGHAQTGTLDSNNFKTLVGATSLSNNDMTDVFQITPNLFMLVASSLVTNTGVKMKFIRYAGWNATDMSRASQTQWTTFAIQS